MSNNNYTYLKPLGNNQHLLYSKERKTNEIWESTQNKLRIYNFYKPVRWRNTNLVYRRDLHPVSPLQKAVLRVNRASIEIVKREKGITT